MTTAATSTRPDDRQQDQTPERPVWNPLANPARTRRT